MPGAMLFVDIGMSSVDEVTDQDLAPNDYIKLAIWKA